MKLEEILEIASPMPLPRAGSHGVSFSRPFQLSFDYIQGWRDHSLYGEPALVFSYSSSEEKKKFLPSSCPVGNDAVPLLKFTYGSPIYLNHVDLSSS